MNSSVVAYFENRGIKIWHSVCIEWQFDSNEIPYGSDSFYYETIPVLHVLILYFLTLSLRIHLL
ncbi:hypothetical protein [Leptospira kirschneri]|uniref:hypothetical protein n=1 Tax=Leptospira kirschneri TaxID=29507 RepID=UPI001E3F9A05|nr:hypothetical protein [Leptospira kirschneri]